jgi:hypothetical protein
MTDGAEHARPWDVHCSARENRMLCMLGRAHTRDHGLSDPSATCSITHEPISESSVPGLPQRWLVEATEYDSMRMPCGHLFHISTLMMHFLTNDMRCPVCRQGALAKASLECVPENTAAAFASKLAEMQDRAEELEIHEIGLYTSREVLEQGLRLVVEVHSALDVTVLSSRLSCESAPPNADGAHAVFRAQQSFHRRLEQRLTALAALPALPPLPAMPALAALPSQSTAVALVFRICHSLLEESICSDPLPLEVYRRICGHQHHTRELHRQSQLRFMNVPCGELVPSTWGPYAAFLFRLNREYVHLLLLSRLQMYLAEYGAEYGPGPGPGPGPGAVLAA